MSAPQIVAVNRFTAGNGQPWAEAEVLLASQERSFVTFALDGDTDERALRHEAMLAVSAAFDGE